MGRGRTDESRREICSTSRSPTNTTTTTVGTVVALLQLSMPILCNTSDTLKTFIDEKKSNDISELVVHFPKGFFFNSRVSSRGSGTDYSEFSGPHNRRLGRGYGKAVEFITFNFYDGREKECERLSRDYGDGIIVVKIQGKLNLNLKRKSISIDVRKGYKIEKPYAQEVMQLANRMTGDVSLKLKEKFSSIAGKLPHKLEEPPPAEPVVVPTEKPVSSNNTTVVVPFDSPPPPLVFPKLIGAIRVQLHPNYHYDYKTLREMIDKTELDSNIRTRLVVAGRLSEVETKPGSEEKVRLILEDGTHQTITVEFWKRDIYPLHNDDDDDADDDDEDSHGRKQKNAEDGTKQFNALKDSLNELIVVCISAKSTEGVFYGCDTKLVLMPTSKSKQQREQHRQREQQMQYRQSNTPPTNNIRLNLRDNMFYTSRSIKELIKMDSMDIETIPEPIIVSGYLSHFKLCKKHYRRIVLSLTDCKGSQAEIEFLPHQLVSLQHDLQTITLPALESNKHHPIALCVQERKFQPNAFIGCDSRLDCG